MEYGRVILGHPHAGGAFLSRLAMFLMLWTSQAWEADLPTVETSPSPPPFRIDSKYLSQRFEHFGGDELFVLQSQWYQVTSPKNPIGEIYCVGPIEVHSQEDIDKLEGCEILLGDLIIKEVEDLDLTPLRFLRIVGGSLHVWDTQLTSLSGLESIKTIEEDLMIGNFRHHPCFGGSGCVFGGRTERLGNPNLANLEGLNSIARIGGNCIIQYNDNLVSLAGFENLREVVGVFEVFENPRLTSLMGLTDLRTVGSMSLRSNRELQSLEGMPALKRIERDLSLRGNSNLTNLSEIPSHLVGVFPGTLILNGLPATDLHFLDGLTEVSGTLSLSGFSQIVNLNGLENLRRVGGNLNVTDNIVLSSLQGLDTLEEVGGLDLSRNKNLEHLSGLFNLEIIHGNFTMRALRNINNLSGLESLRKVSGTIHLEDASLINFVGMEELTTIGGDLNIVGCNEIENLVGFDGLNTIGGHLNLRGNDKLATVEGMEYLVSIDKDLVIYKCFALTDISAFLNLNNISNAIDIRFTPLVSLNGLKSLTSLPGIILESVDIENLNGLGGFDKIHGHCFIHRAKNLTDLSGLQNLKVINGLFSLYDNAKLVSLGGLENLETVGWNLTIWENQSLNDIGALSHLNHVGGTIEVRDNTVLDCRSFDLPFFPIDLSVGNAVNCPTPN